ncbi:MAG: HAD hydrolase family protein [Capsulimonadales bacterium]|nr:HAD hydrolase family protein [Capsulimonadales bacterium]
MSDLGVVRLLALDVDGTLTDGTVIYSDAGQELKAFHIQDGLGIVLAGFSGLGIAWITGRDSPVVRRRAAELKVGLLLQGVRDKGTALSELMVRHGYAPSEVAFMGDDLNDLPAMGRAGVAIAPANAVSEVKRVAHYVTPRAGGQGAVRDAIEMILRARGDYDAALGSYLTSLTVSAKNVVH